MQESTKQTAALVIATASFVVTVLALIVVLSEKNREGAVLIVILVTVLICSLVLTTLSVYLNLRDLQRAKRANAEKADMEDKHAREMVRFKHSHVGKEVLDEFKAQIRLMEYDLLVAGKTAVMLEDAIWLAWDFRAVVKDRTAVQFDATHLSVLIGRYMNHKKHLAEDSALIPIGEQLPRAVHTDVINEVLDSHIKLLKAKCADLVNPFCEAKRLVADLCESVQQGH